MRAISMALVAALSAAPVVRAGGRAAVGIAPYGTHCAHARARAAVGIAPYGARCARPRARALASSASPADDADDEPPPSPAAALAARFLAPARELLVISCAVDLSEQLADFSTEPQADRLGAALRAAARATMPTLEQLVAVVAAVEPAALLAPPPPGLIPADGAIPPGAYGSLPLSPVAALGLARLAAWSSPAAWVRPLAEWAPPPPPRADAGGEGEAAERVLRSLREHLLEAYPTAPALHGVLTHADHPRAGGRAVASSLSRTSGATPALLRAAAGEGSLRMQPYGSRALAWLPCGESAHRVARAFFAVLAETGGGRASVRAALGVALRGYAVTKREAKEFAELPTAAGGDGVAGALAAAAAAAAAPPGAPPPSADATAARLSPLHCWREAAARAQGLPAWAQRAACVARMGGEVGPDASAEAFACAALQWASTQAGELDSGGELQLSALLDYAQAQQRARGGEFEMAGRTVKRVLAALEQWAPSTIEFDNDEAFEPNPKGLAELFREGATIPAGVKLHVPYDSADYGGHGVYALGGAGERGSELLTVRIAEVRSLKRLVYEGRQLGNCLEDKYESQLKYIQRARQRVSSFWSLTYLRPGEAAPEHKCLLEVWHLREGDIVRQAEGPRPRTIPSADAFYWLNLWCDANGVDLGTWDCYSRLETPINPDEFARKGRI
jgi:hypothetical protein